MSTIRKKVVDALIESHNQILKGVHVLVGNTVTRAISVLDEIHFAVEQRISISFQPPHNDKGWTSECSRCLPVPSQPPVPKLTHSLVLIWTDSGSRSEFESMEMSFTSALEIKLPLEDSLLPVITYEPMMGLNAHQISRDSPVTSSEPQIKVSAPQFGYGSSLRQSLMAYDQFYALTEIFAFAASSEKRFLNLVENKLERIDPDSRIRGNLELDTLRHLDQVLYRHVRQIRNTVTAVELLKHPKWPRSDEQAAKRAREAVKHDLQDLYEHATAVYKRCQKEITILMNSIVILESEKAIDQSERTRRLTFLALIFAPLSFTTSFFGMNVKGLQGLFILFWCLMSFLVLLASVCFMVLNVQLNWSRLKEKTMSLLR